MLPAAIIFVNNDLNDILKNILISQLQIDETMDGYEFDARVTVDPNYPTNIHLNNLRVLVIRDSFQDFTNRSLADIVMFLKGGLATILKSNFGPPGLAVEVGRINIYQLLRYNKSNEVIVLPSNCYPKHNTCCCQCFPLTGPGGIVGIELRADDLSCVHMPNCDNEYNNEAFINRK